MVKIFKPKRKSKDEKIVQKRSKIQKKPLITSLTNKNLNKFKSRKTEITEIIFSIQKKFEKINLLPINYEHDKIGSYFYDKLQKLQNLDETREFYILHKRLITKGTTLSLIILNKKEIFKILLEEISKREILKKCVFELIFSFLRDLKNEAYFLILNNFDIFINELENEDLGVAENSLFVLAGFFKFLFKFLIENFEKFSFVFLNFVFQKIRKQYVLRLLVESFCYIFRKNKEEKKKLKLFEIFFENIQKIYFSITDQNQKNKLEFFVSYFLFENFKGYQNIFSLQTFSNLKIFFHFIKKNEKNFSNEISNFLKNCFRYAIFKLIKIEFKFINTKKDDNKKYLIDFFKFGINFLKSDLQSSKIISEFFFNFGIDLFLFQNSILLKNDFLEVLKNFLFFSKKFEISQKFLILLSLFFLKKKILLEKILDKILICEKNFLFFLENIFFQNKILEINFNFEKKIDFVNKEKFTEFHFDLYQINYLFEKNENFLLQKKNESFKILFLLSKNFERNFPNQKILIKNPKIENLIKNIFKNQKKINFEIFSLSIFLTITKFQISLENELINFLKKISKNEKNEKISKIDFFTNLDIEILYNSEIKKSLNFFNFEISKKFFLIIKSYIYEYLILNINTKYIEKIINLITKNPNFFPIYENLLKILINHPKILKTENCEKKNLFCEISKNLINCNKKSRIVILRILNIMDSKKKIENSEVFENISFFEILIKIEKIVPGINSEREIVSLLNNLKMEIRIKKFEKKKILSLFFFSIGYLWVRYNNIKKATQLIILEILLKNEFFFYRNFIINFLHGFFYVKRENEKNEQKNENFEIEIENNDNFEIGEFYWNFFVNQKKNYLDKNFFCEFTSDILSMNAKLVEKNFEDFYNLFINFIKNEKSLLNKKLLKIYKKEENSEKSEILEEKKNYCEIFYEKKKKSEKIRKKVISENISIYIKIFGNFTKMDKFSKKKILKKLLLKSLQYFQNDLFSINLKAILRIDRIYINDQIQFLSELNEKNNFKDKILNLDLKKMAENEKFYFIEILKNILISFFFNLKAQKNKKFIFSKQNFILNFISGFEKNERDFILKGFFDYLEINFFDDFTNENFIFEKIGNLGFSKMKKIMYFLDLIFKNFSQNLKIYKNLYFFLLKSLNFFKNLQNYITNSKKVEICEKTIFLNSIKNIRKLILNQIINIYINYIEEKHNNFTDELILNLKENFSKLEKTKDFGSVFKLSLVWSEFEIYKLIFLKNEKLFLNVINPLNNLKIENNMAVKIFDFIFNFFEFSIGNNQKQKIINTDIILQKLKNEKNFNFENFENFEKSENMEIENLDNKIYIENEEKLKLSKLGIYIIQRNSEKILNSIIFFLEQKIKKNRKYIPNENLIDIIFLISNYCKITNQKTIENILKIFQVYLKPKNINNLILGEKRISAGKYNFILKMVLKIKNIFLIISKFLKNYEKIDDYFYYTIIPLFSYINHPEIFFCFQKILENISKNKFFSYKKSLEIFEKVINRNSKKLIFDFDTEKIYLCLNEINLEFFENLEIKEIEMILLIFLKFLGSNDLSVRIKTLEIFNIFFNFFEKNKNDKKKIIQNINFVNKILTYLKNKVSEKIENEEKFKYYIKLFSLYINFIKKNANHFPVEIKLKFFDLQELDNLNFFEDIVNLKYTTKIKSLFTLKENLENNKISNSSKITFLLPLIQNLISYQYFILNKFTKFKNSKAGTFKNYLHIASDCCRLLTNGMNFKKIVMYLSKSFSRIDNSDFKNVIFKINSAILDNLENIEGITNCCSKIDQDMRKENLMILKNSGVFKSVYDLEEEEIGEIRNNLINREEEQIGGLENENDMILETQNIFTEEINFVKENKNGEDDENLDKEKNFEVENIDVYKKLKNHILKKIKTQLFKKKDKDDTNEIILTEIILKIIRFFPLKIFKTELLKIIIILVQMLKIKNESIRKKSLKALLDISVITGPFFFHLIIKELKFHLKLGVLRHVRNYSIWFLLDKIFFKDIKKNFDFNLGNLDYCFIDIIDCALEENFSEMFKEKDSIEMKNKSKEIKRHKANQLFFIVGKYLHYDSGLIFKIIDKIIYELEKSKDLKFGIERTNGAFNSFIRGLIENESLTTEKIIIIVFIYNERAMKDLKFNEKKQKREVKNNMAIVKKQNLEDFKRYRIEENFKIQEGAAQGKSIFRILADKKNSKKNFIARCLTRFSLKFFSECLKNEKLNFTENLSEILKKNNIHLPSFYAQLRKLMNCSYDEITFFTLNLIFELVNSNYNYDIENIDFFKNLIKILSRLTPQNLDLIDIVFKLLIKIFRKKVPKINYLEYEILFHSLNEFIYISDDIKGPILFLETLIDIQFIKPQIYDLIKKNFNTFFETNENFFREKSREIIILFITKFPIDENLLIKYFTTLLNNLEQDNYETRKGLFKFIFEFLKKYKTKYFQKYLKIYFLKLVTSRVNEENIENRLIIDEILKYIIFDILENEENKKIFFNNNFILDIYKLSIQFFKNENYQINFSGVIIIKTLLLTNHKIVIKKLLKENFYENLEQKFLEINDNINIFKDCMKNNKEMKSKYNNTPWKEFFISKLDHKKEFDVIQEKKNYLFYLLNFISEISNIENQEFLNLSQILQLTNLVSSHPVSEIHNKILEIKKNLLKNHKKEILAEPKNFGIIMVYLLNLVKKKYYNLEDYNFIEILVDFIKLSFFENEMFYNLSLEILNKIVSITTGKINYNKLIIERIISILYKLVFSLGDDFEFNDNFLEIFVKYFENKQIRDIEDFNIKLNEIFDFFKNDKNFQLAYFEKKKIFLERRMNLRAEEKILAVTNPVLYAEKKQKKNLGRRRKLKKKKEEEYLSGRN